MDYNEEKIKQVERDVYGGEMPAHNKSVLRDTLRKEDKFWERYEAREEEGHSHSVVGDLYNADNQE